MEEPEYLDILAVAYAETGDFDLAAKYHEMAITLFEESGAEVPDHVKDRLKAYHSREPYRD